MKTSRSFLGQDFDRRFQADETILEIVRLAPVRGGGEVSPGIERVETDQAAPAIVVAADVPGQPEKPEPDRLRMTDRIELSAGLEVNVLAEVFGDGGIPGKSQA